MIGAAAAVVVAVVEAHALIVAKTLVLVHVKVAEVAAVLAHTVAPRHVAEDAEAVMYIDNGQNSGKKHSRWLAIRRC